MSARLFRRIKSSFSRLNKTFFFSVALGLVVVFFSVSHVLADAATDYRYYLKNFTTSNDGKLTSGIGGGTVAAASKNGTGGDGLVFVANLGVDTSSPHINASVNEPDSIALHWGRVAHINEAFVIKVCQNGTTQCYLNTVAYTNNRADPGVQAFSETDTDGNIADKQALPVVAFTKTDPRNTGNIYGYDATNKTVSTSNGITFGNGSSLTATFWYCAVKGTGDPAPQDYLKANPSATDAAVFGNLCGGSTYFQIGGPLSITIPLNANAINQQVTQSSQTVAAGSSASSSDNSNIPTCGVTSGTKLYGCVAYLAYGIYVLVAWVAGILGSLFDFFLGYSVSDASYRYGFAVNGWKLVRDISNIFFIIIMVWTGFSAVFDTSKSGSMRKIVPALIINALLINFSLFATRVVIDISNITARMFYSQMVVCDKVNIDTNTGKCDPLQARRGPGGYWPLSEKIISSFNPQQLFKTATLQPTTAPSNTSTTNSSQPGFLPGATAGTAGTSEVDYVNYFMVVCIVAAIIMGFAGVIFFKVAFLFIARVVGLYICMIFSPFAFLSRDIPMLGKIKQLRWEDWLGDLTNYALMAPVFTFFLYVIFTVISSDFAQQIGYMDSSGTFMGTVLSIVIPMALIYFLLDAAKSAATKLSGSVGQKIQGFGEQITGMAAGTALGLATGGAGFLGRNVVGRAAKSFGEGKTGRQIEIDGKMVDETRAMSIASRSATSWSARQKNKLLRATQVGSFNVGNAGVNIGGKDYKLNDTIGRSLGLMGVKTNNLLKNADYVGDDAGKGGIVAVDKKRTEERQKELENRIQFDHLSDDEAKATWEAHKRNAALKNAEGNWKNNDNIDKEDGVKETAELLKTATEKEVALSKENADLEQKLATATAAGSTAEIAALTASKTAKEKEVSDNQTRKNALTTTIETERKNKITELEKGKYMESEAYKAAEKTERERLDKFGKIKNGKMLTAAMRSEYGEDLRKNSFWLKDGKPRYDQAALVAEGGVIGGAAGAAAMASLLPGITIAIGTMLGVSGGVIDNRFGDINSKATKAMVDSFKKTQGKGNKETRLAGEIDAINDQIKQAAEAHGTVPSGGVDSWSEEDVETAIAGHTYILQQEKEALHREASARGVSEEVKRAKTIEAQLKQKKIDKLNKAMEEKRRIQNELDKIKTAADNAKKDEPKK